MSEENLELLCIGNALVDIFAVSEEGLDRQFNLNEGAQHISMEKMRDILSVLPDFKVCSGGGTANVAKIASLLGIKTGFIGALGAAPDQTSDSGITDYDQFGRLFEEQLNEAGVNSVLLKKSSPTGVCLMLKLPDGKIKIAAAPSAALELCEDDLDDSLLNSAHAVVLDGYMLGREAIVRYILELADAYGTAVALDLSSAGLAYDRALEIITYARAYPMIIFMNEDEAYAFFSAISRKEKTEKSEAGLSKELIKLFRDFTANDIFPILVVKLGKRGAVVFAGGQIFREETIPIIPFETTGAGDTFCAAFLAAWIREKSFSECAGFGNKAAREVLYANGSQADPKIFKRLAKPLRRHS